MGKKFLLYIHNSKFEDETNKSKLVNELLDKHYNPQISQENNDIPSCCTQSKPCKHWHYNDIEQTWVNELTGEVKSIDNYQ